MERGARAGAVLGAPQAPSTPMDPVPSRTTTVPQFPCYGQPGGGLWGGKWLNRRAAGAAGSPVPSPTGHGAPGPPAMRCPQAPQEGTADR